MGSRQVHYFIRRTAPKEADNTFIGGIKMINLKKYEFWFVTGSQHLYGPQTLMQVEENAKTIAGSLDKNAAIPCRIVFKAVQQLLMK